jgi:transposase
MGYKRREVYTPEFRAAAVRMAAEGRKTLSEIAVEIGVSRQLLYTWCRNASVEASGTTHGEAVTDKDAEIRRLRREVDRLTEERDILKKAAAFFAKESR